MRNSKKTILILVIIAAAAILGSKYYQHNFRALAAEEAINNVLQQHQPVWILFRSQT